MKHKVKEIGEKYSRKLEQLEGIEAIVMGDTSDMETFDPYFVIELDVYYSGTILSSEERRLFLNNPPTFETLPTYPVDRFLENNLPMVIYYREISGIDRMMERIASNQWVYRPDISNTLYQIHKGAVVHSRSDWFSAIQNEIGSLDRSFWLNLMNSSRVLIESALMELGASLLKDDMILYNMSLASFIRYICGFIFSLNRKFEPPSKLLGEQLKSLKILPDEFLSRFDILCKKNTDYSLTKKVEIARLLAKSLIPIELGE